MRVNAVEEKIKSALIRLLKKKNYLSITVTDIVQEAGVARASFYRVFGSIDKVLDNLYIDLKDRLTKFFIPYYLNRDILKLKDEIRFFLSSIREKNFPLINILPENRQFILPKFENQFVNYKGVSFNRIEDKYRIPLMVMTVYSVAMVWAYCGCVEPIDDVIDFIVKEIY